MAAGEPAAAAAHASASPAGDTSAATVLSGASLAAVPPVAPTSVPAVVGTQALAAAGTPVAQLVSVLTPLRTTVDGSHQVTLVLQPEGLGVVRATVTVTGQAVAVHLVADTPEARQVLGQSLGELQARLSQDGASVSLSLASDGRSGGRGQADSRQAGPNRRRTDDRQEQLGSLPIMVRAPIAAGGGRVDLRL